MPASSPLEGASGAPRLNVALARLVDLKAALLAEKSARGPELRGGMVKLKVVISFKRLQVIFIHSYGSSIAPKMTF